MQYNYLCSIILLHPKKTIYRGVEQLVARRAHNPKVVGSSPSSATNNAHRKRYRCENPETTAVSGFSSAIFQSEIQKISFPQNDLWGGIEKNIATGMWF